MNEFDIITVGSATRDVFLSDFGGVRIKDPQFPTGEALALGFGSKLEVKKIVLTTGGGGTNAAVTFARQGFKTACIGVLGKDSNSMAVLDELSREGVLTDFFQRHDDDVTAYSVILVDGSGERTILSYKGEGQHFEATAIPFDRIAAKWVFLDSIGGHYDLLMEAVAWAQKNGVKIATNPGGKELAHGLEKLRPLLENAAIVSMNQEEAGQLLNVDFKDKDAIFKKMDEIVKGVFVMTNGHEGVSVSDGTAVYSAGVPDSPVVERTGAGDAFASGFTAEYIRSGDIPKAIQLGTANASSVVTQFGGKAGILKAGDMGSWPLVEVSKK
ncbi:MAG TPA: carbohydrate kinase family protein [Candidatus Paceibacterota bacterium]|nr:carbohydrate kinase family protein [Candidatus Paceibacterota bacterium]